MPQPWQIVTQSTSEDIISKSETLRLWNPTHMIKVGSCHQIIPRTCQIVTTEGRSTGREIVCILLKPHIPNSSSLDFENPNENLSLASQTKSDKMFSDPIWSWVIYFTFYFSVMYLVYNFFLLYVVIIHLLWRG